jgi:hypothetical protein
MSAKKNYLVVENVSISSALPKRYTKRSGQRCRTTSIGSSAKTVTKTTSTAFTANSANRFTPTIRKTTTMIGGSAVTTASDG